MMVASPGIEPGSGASETLILSIVLQGQYIFKYLFFQFYALVRNRTWIWNFVPTILWGLYYPLYYKASIFLNTCFFQFYALVRNRTWIWSFVPTILWGLYYPLYYKAIRILNKEQGILNVELFAWQVNHSYFPKCVKLLPNIFTAMASNITPKNFLMTTMPFGPSIFSIHFRECRTR